MKKSERVVMKNHEWEERDDEPAEKKWQRKNEIEVMHEA